MEIQVRLRQFWGSIAGIEPAVPAASYQPHVPPEDDPESIVETSDEPPQWAADSISGRNLIIVYTDSRGQGSERQIVCRSLEQKANGLFLNAICMLRHRSRTFRADRVSEIIDPITGEVHAPGLTYLSDFLPDSVSTSSFRYGLSVQEYSALNSALNVLAFMARCDGNWHPLEQDAIEEFVTSYWMRSEIAAHLDLNEVARHAARLAPDAEVFWTSMMACSRHLVLGQIICRHISALIDADGFHHPNELYWGRQIDEFLRDARDDR